MIEDQHLGPGKVVYAKVPVANADDTIDFACEGLDASHDIQEIIGLAVDMVEEHGGEIYVYECRPVRKIVRGKTRIITLKK